MDTAHALITDCPGREVNLLAGGGTFFNEREKFFLIGCTAGGPAPWSAPLPPRSRSASTAPTRTNCGPGTVTATVSGRHRRPATSCSACSKEENDTIRGGLSRALNDHLVDVVDTADGPQMTLRSGASLPITPGSWLVNCTGYIVHRSFPTSLLLPGGRVLSIQSTSATLHLSSFMAYFSTHLFLSGRWPRSRSHELDMLDLYEKARKAWSHTLMTLVEHNLGLYFDSLPSKAFRDCGLDFDLWYPLPAGCSQRRSSSATTAVTASICARP